MLVITVFTVEPLKHHSSPRHLLHQNGNETEIENDIENEIENNIGS